MPKPRKDYSLEECQRMCQDDKCTAWQWWPVEGGCRWFTGKVYSEEKEGHPSVGGTMDCDSSDLTYNGAPIPRSPVQSDQAATPTPAPVCYGTAISGSSPGSSIGGQSYFAASLEDCQSKCSVLNECKAVVYWAGIQACRLLERTYQGKYQAAEGAVVANKRPFCEADCSNFMTAHGCGWTDAWSCPGQKRGTSGVAKDDAALGQMGYYCCCDKELWKAKSDGNRRLFSNGFVLV